MGEESVSKFKKFPQTCKNEIQYFKTISPFESWNLHFYNNNGSNNCGQKWAFDIPFERPKT